MCNTVCKILTGTNDIVEIVPVTNQPQQSSFIECFTSVGDYGNMLFQKINLSDLTIWISHYYMYYETRFVVEVPDPFLEAHITLKNRMVQSLGPEKNAILNNREFNITYAPFMVNRVFFPAGGEYMTFDIHPSEGLLMNWSQDFPALEKFLNRRLPGAEPLIQLFSQHVFLDPEMEYVVRRIIRHIAVPDASRVLTQALALELLAMFLLRAEKNRLPQVRHHNRHTEALLHAREIIEYEANTFDSEELISTEIQIADRIGLSLYQLKEGFKRLFGINPYQLNHELRLRRAQGLLRDTFYPVSEIAMRTGFKTSEGFIRAYKRRYQITPSMERQK